MTDIPVNFTIVTTDGECPVSALIHVDNMESTTGQGDVSLGHALALRIILDDHMSFESFKDMVRGGAGEGTWPSWTSLVGIDEMSAEQNILTLT
jgi:hypothetical protein